MRPHIYVIIPFFNVCDFLDECIQSVLIQNGEFDLKIILVDDGSSDNSLNVAKKYLTDNRVNIITKCHTGVSDNRNLGLNFVFSNLFKAQNNHKIKYKENYKVTYFHLEEKLEFTLSDLCVISLPNSYILFLDSDDYLEKNGLKILFDAIKNNDAMLALNFNEIVSMTTHEFLLYKKWHYLSEITGILMKSSILENIRFTYGIQNEDHLFKVDLFLKNYKMISVKEKIMNIRARSGSISHPDSFNNVGFAFLENTYLVITTQLINMLQTVDNKKIKKFLIRMIKYNVNGLMIYIILQNKKLKDINLYKYMKLKHKIYVKNPFLFKYMQFIYKLFK